MMAESFLMFQYWLEQSVLRSKTEPGKSSPGFIQWLEAQDPGHRDSRNYSLQEDSIALGRTGLVLSLLWWKNEKQLLDLDEDDY
jgi:hypothetical protein